MLIESQHFAVSVLEDGLENVVKNLSMIVTLTLASMEIVWINITASNVSVMMVSSAALINLFATNYTQLYADYYCTYSIEETFLQDFLVILKRMLQNY